jgi:phosphoribosylglycinamide formyltransferase 1
MRLAVFASGGGSNLQVLLDASASGRLGADIALVVTDREGIGALERAARHGVATTVVRPADFATPDDFGEALLAELTAQGVSMIALAGYLRHIPAKVVHAYRHRLLNVHPSLLPAFGGAGLYGRRVHEAVLAYGVRWSGATVHLVDEEYDTGPIVLQEPVPVHRDDTPASLAARILQVEHRLLPEAVRLVAERRLRVDGRRVTILDDAETEDRESDQPDRL